MVLNRFLDLYSKFLVTGYTFKINWNIFCLVSGVAQMAEVELLSVERGLSAALPGELSDVTANNLIRFDELNPFTYTDKSIVVKNKT